MWIKTQDIKVGDKLAGQRERINSIYDYEDGSRYASISGGVNGINYGCITFQPGGRYDIEPQAVPIS